MTDKVLNQALAFLGKKIDDLKVAFLSKSVTVDVGDSMVEMSKEIVSPIEAGLEKLSAAIQKQTAAIGNKKSPDVCLELQKLQYELKQKRIDLKVEGQKISFDPVIAAIKEMSDLVANKKQDNTEILKALQELKVAFKGIKMEVKPPDFRPVVAGLAALEQNLQYLAAVVKENAPEKIGDKIDAMDAVFKGLKPKDTVRFDDKQMQGLMSALTNSRGGITTGGDVLAAREVSVANVSMPTANTQYSYTFPANTVGFQLRTRDLDVPLLISFTTGTLPTSGDGSAYFTVPAYFVEKTAGLDWSGKTIYMQAATASQVIEIINYKA